MKLSLSYWCRYPCLLVIKTQRKILFHHTLSLWGMYESTQKDQPTDASSNYLRTRNRHPPHDLAFYNFCFGKFRNQWRKGSSNLSINHLVEPRAKFLSKSGEVEVDRWLFRFSSEEDCLRLLGLRAINKPLKLNYPWLGLLPLPSSTLSVGWYRAKPSQARHGVSCQTILIGVCVCLESIKICARKMIDLQRGPCRALVVVSWTATMTKFIDTPSRQN